MVVFTGSAGPTADLLTHPVGLPGRFSSLTLMKSPSVSNVSTRSPDCASATGSPLAAGVARSVLLSFIAPLAMACPPSLAILNPAEPATSSSAQSRILLRGPAHSTSRERGQARLHYALP